MSIITSRTMPRAWAKNRQEDKIWNLLKFGLWQWAPRESNAAAITDATYSCDSQSIYASFEDGSVCVFTAAGLKLRCRISPAAYLHSNQRSVSKYLHLEKCHKFRDLFSSSLNWSTVDVLQLEDLSFSRNCSSNGG